MANLERSLRICRRIPIWISITRSYRSPYSLDRLYPNTSKEISIPMQPSKSKDKEFNGFIPLDRVQVRFDTEDSRVAEIRFPTEKCDWIPSSVKDEFFRKYQYRIDKDGFFTVRSDRTRVASLNVADCLDKLRFSIRECELKEEKSKDIMQEIEGRRIKQEIEAKKKLQIKKTSI